MSHTYRPFAHAKSVYEIDLDFFKAMGVEVLFIDLDNTLDSYKLFHPTERAKKLIPEIIAKGIRPVIVSNNRGKRVRTYANDLNIEYLNSCAKPFPFKINKFIKNNNLDKNKVMLVGDQMMTDVLAGKHAGIRVVLTEKIVKEDQFTTHFNRLIDRPIRRHHRKKGNLRNWRDL